MFAYNTPRLSHTAERPWDMTRAHDSPLRLRDLRSPTVDIVRGGPAGLSFDVQAAAATEASAEIGSEHNGRRARSSLAGAVRPICVRA